jgi:hypothetical protein
MKNLTLIFLLILGLGASDFLHAESRKFTISGQVKDGSSGESLIGASVYIDEIQSGTITNLYGFYSISLDPGTYHVRISFIGFENQNVTINLIQNTTQNFELVPGKSVLKAVTVTGAKGDENITSREMGAVKMEMKTVEKIPALLGEVDVIKALQLLPGVQASGEGISGYSVRGGSKDQNLILLDEASVYNASHLLGFFSIFNNDAIKEVKLYKGDIPAKYGGRLSSLLEVYQKEGNMKEYHARGGMGTVSSRITVEGPLIKDRSSFMLSGRRSYADLFLKLSKREELKNNRLYFYDLNGKVNLVINNNNRLFLSAYNGRDIVSIKGDEEFPPFKMGWGNNTISLRWNHLFSPKLFANFSFIYSKYDYRLGIEDDVQGFEWVSLMDDHTVKGDFVWYLHTSSTVKFGVHTTYHDFWPGIARGEGNQTIFGELKIPEARALEHGIYLSNDQTISKKLSLNYGLRFTMFQNMGVGVIYNFDDHFEALDSTVYPHNKIFNRYYGWEPRINFVYLMNEVSSIKGSYNRTMQYIHLASNSTIGSPLDVYLPSSPNIKPQSANQVALGYYRNFRDNLFETSVEVYYKKMHDQVDFRDHAELILNPKIEGEVRTAEGEAYGVELLIRKQKGNLTGWISYTLSRSTRVSPWINDGKLYLSPYDRTHDVAVVASYQITPTLSASGTWVFASGAPVTFPTGRFVYGNVVTPVYSDRNSYRMPAFHRLDLGVTWDPVKKSRHHWQSSWTFSVYNAYNRHNAFMISFVENKQKPGTMEAEMIYLFPVIPAITYNFNF